MNGPVIDTKTMALIEKLESTPYFARFPIHLVLEKADLELIVAALRAIPIRAAPMALPTCAVTGRIAGDGFACGDCDPCSAAHAVPEVVKRLIAERDEWADKYADAMDRCSPETDRAGTVPSSDQWNALVGFVQWAIENGPWMGQELEGADVQDEARQAGLIVETKYDPEVHGDAEMAEYVEAGDPWFVFADWLKPSPTCSPDNRPAHVGMSGYLNKDDYIADLVNENDSVFAMNERLRAALVKLLAWNKGIEAGEGNHHPQDHIDVIAAALTSG